MPDEPFELQIYHVLSET